MFSFFKKKKTEDETWQSYALEARNGKKLTGFYNENYKFYIDGTPYLFRFPIKDAVKVDPRAFTEQDVLKLIQETDIAAPKLEYSAADTSFYVEDFIEGFTVEYQYPPGEHIPESILSDIANFYGILADAEIKDVDRYLEDDWRSIERTSIGFFKKLVEFTRDLYQENLKTCQKQYDFLGLGEDPCIVFVEEANKLAERPWRLMHADLHRGNMIVGHDQSVNFIDWELALYGDTVN